MVRSTRACPPGASVSGRVPPAGNATLAVSDGVNALNLAAGVVSVMAGGEDVTVGSSWKKTAVAGYVKRGCAVGGAMSDANTGRSTIQPSVGGAGGGSA